MKPEFLITLAAVMVGLTSPQAQAQDFDPSLTDPTEIAQECGGDAARGAALWAQCADCHALEHEAASRSGPNLNGVYGASAGSRGEFPYSEALVNAGFDGLIWEPEKMHAFLTAPESLIPGMGGGHRPIENEQDRRDLMTYLRTNSLPPPPAASDVTIPPEIWEIAADPAYGEYLAGDCMSCHSAEAAARQGLKPLGHAGREGFVRAMFEYRARARSHDVMQMVAQSLGDEEIVSLAAYFSKNG